MQDVGKFVLIVGLVIAGIGLLMWSGVGKGWFGKLPGDIHVDKGNVQFYFPFATCLLISAVLTLLMWIFRQ